MDWKILGSTPDDITELFQWTIFQHYSPISKARLTCNANGSAIYELKTWEPRRLTAPWATKTCYRDNCFAKPSLKTIGSIREANETRSLEAQFL
jgi:hypothetical protein